MKHSSNVTLKNFFFVFMILNMLLVPGLFISRPAAAAPIYTCLPTCEEHDGRFLSVAGQGLKTMADEVLHIEFAAPPDATSLEIGIFDGDTGGLWDLETVPMEYTLYADPLAQGDENVQVGQWVGTSMPDDDWFTVSIPTGANAQSSSGYFFYHMDVSPTQLNPSYWSNFKVRTDGVVSLAPQAFAFTAALLTEADGYIIYPNGPNDLTETKYDGRFDFHAYSMNSMDHFAVWDGDLDFGSFDLADLDTDDPDTPDNVLPGWAGPSAVFEGVAVGANGSTGAPNDDHRSAIYRRSPSVVYDLAPLDQVDYTNTNPSGNLEWEQFLLDTNNANHPDVHVNDRLPAGLYHMHLRGMDLANLNAWRFAYNVVGVCAYDPETQESNPCKDLPHPYLIGDTVFDDANADGVQNNGETGIPGVEVCLFDGEGFPILDIYNNQICKTTDENGEYFFDVEPYTVDPYTGEVTEAGVYTVQVTPGNFISGGPLYNLASTTGGQEQTNTVIDANVLTYDFGYTTCPGTVEYCPCKKGGHDGKDGYISQTSYGSFGDNYKTGDQKCTCGQDSYGSKDSYSSQNSFGGKLGFGYNNFFDFTSYGTGDHYGDNGHYQGGGDGSKPDLDLSTCPAPNPGTGTIGYWKNHPQDWPVGSITIGGEVYTKWQAIWWMYKPSRGDKTIDLFKQLVAAKLNVLIGNESSCIEADIQAADDWLVQHPVGSGVSGSSSDWAEISDVHTALDNYNNGLLCAPHRH